MSFDSLKHWIVECSIPVAPLYDYAKSNQLPTSFLPATGIRDWEVSVSNLDMAMVHEFFMSSRYCSLSSGATCILKCPRLRTSSHPCHCFFWSHHSLQVPHQSFPTTTYSSQCSSIPLTRVQRCCTHPMVNNQGGRQ